MDKREIGSKGEQIAATFLEGKGHNVVCKNYRMKFGEIDIVTEKDATLYFIEVKTVAREPGFKQKDYRIEERVTPAKLVKLSRVVEFYLSRECKDKNQKWEFWVITVTLDNVSKRAFVKVIPETLT